MEDDAGAEMTLLVAEVYELASSLRRHGEAFAATVGQTQARWQLLSVVSADAWTVPQAARRLGVSRQAVQRVADELDAEGLVRLVPNPQHRRSPLLELTAQGRSALASITDAAAGWQSDIAGNLDRRVLRKTRAVLRQIIEQIEAVDAEQPAGR